MFREPLFVAQADTFAVKNDPSWSAASSGTLGSVPPAPARDEQPSTVETIARKPSHLTSYA
jgi:hypothetical protein